MIWFNRSCNEGKRRLQSVWHLASIWLSQKTSRTDVVEVEVAVADHVTVGLLYAAIQMTCHRKKRGRLSLSSLWSFSCPQTDWDRKNRILFKNEAFPSRMREPSLIRRKMLLAITFSPNNRVDFAMTLLLINQAQWRHSKDIYLAIHFLFDQLLIPRSWNGYGFCFEISFFGVFC